MAFRLYFVKVTRGLTKKQRNQKTKIWTLRKDSDNACGELLGFVSWKGAWRQYVFSPNYDTDWSSVCLRTIMKFLEKVNEENRKKLEKEFLK